MDENRHKSLTSLNLHFSEEREATHILMSCNILKRSKYYEKEKEKTGKGGSEVLGGGQFALLNSII